MSTDTVREARLLPDRRQDHHLVNAEREARARGLFDVPIVDCDSHCYETSCLPEIVAYINGGHEFPHWLRHGGKGGAAVSKRLTPTIGMSPPLR